MCGSVRDETCMTQDWQEDKFVKFIPDESKDMFQIGRSHTDNDFIVHGPLHYNRASGQAGGSVGRYVCRIECERYPPHRCFLYASGYVDNKV